MQQFHKFAEVFPLLEGTEFEALVEDIKANGQQEYITRYEGKILDGRNRFLACNKLGVKVKERKFSGSESEALAYVVSKNLQRRHLSESQRAMAAAQIATLGAGRPAKIPPIGGITASTAAAQLNVGTRSVERAKQVVEDGSKELQRAVVAGEVSVSRAAAVTDLPKTEQLKAATEPPKKPRKQRAGKKPKKDDKPAADDPGKPDDAEAEHLARTEKEIAESTDKIMAADDRLAAAYAEVKRQAAEIASLKVARDGFLNGKGAVEKLLRKEQSLTKRLRADLEKANAKIEDLKERIAIMREKD